MGKLQRRSCVFTNGPNPSSERAGSVHAAAFAGHHFQEVRGQFPGRVQLEHGAGLAVVMPAWMEYVMKADIPRFARFASQVFGVADGDMPAMAKEGIRRYREWLKSLNMPLTFAELGAKEEDIPALVSKLGLNGNTLGGLVQLNDEDVANIFRLAARSLEEQECAL